MANTHGMDEILPLLKDAAWPGREQSVCAPLTDLPIQDQPLVTFGWDRPETFEMLGRQDPLAANLDVLRAAAAANLKKRAGSWQPIEIKLGLFKTGRFLVCGDDFLAAERILDPDFLMQAQRTLDAKMLAVGIPRRGIIMAANGAQSSELLQRFLAAVAGQFHRGEAPPITPTVFGVVDGAIVAHLQDGGVSAMVKDSLRRQ